MINRQLIYAFSLDYTECVQNTNMERFILRKLNNTQSIQNRYEAHRKCFRGPIPGNGPQFGNQLTNVKVFV